MPTVVLAARLPNGADEVDVRVLVDGKPLAQRLDGRAVELEPGDHLLSFQPGVAGAAPVEMRVVVREGEKGRLIVGNLQPVATNTAPAATGTAAPIAAPPPERSGGPSMGRRNRGERGGGRGPRLRVFRRDRSVARARGARALQAELPSSR